MKMIAYDREGAVAYARRWAHGRNREYMDFSNMGGDCTNFVSQCLYAGGMPQTIGSGVGATGWFYRNAANRAAAWSGVAWLYNFLTNGRMRRGPVAVEVPFTNLEVGDIIQLSFDGKKFSHSLIITAFDGGEPLVATHSQDALDRALSTYTFAVARGLHVVGGWA